ncbi:MAG: SH3 domain-containing protein [Pseudomonadota bacterium]
MQRGRIKLKMITRSAVILIILFHGMGFAEYLTVQVPSANVRSGPGPTADLLWRVEQYHPLDIVEKKGDWYRFRDFEGDEGWIHKALMGNIPAVIIKKDKTNIRSGPDTKSDIVFTVEKGIPFKVVSKKGQWIEVEHADGDKGWINAPMVWP